MPEVGGRRAAGGARAQPPMRQFNVQAGLFSVALINSIYNLIAEVIGKRSQAGIDPIVFSLYRDAAAAPILYALTLSSQSKKEPRVPKRAHVWRLALQGFLGIFLNQILFLVGVRLTNGTIGEARRGEAR